MYADNRCDYPAHVRYILQRSGDDLSVKSEFYRWFSSSGFQLAAGSADGTVQLYNDRGSVDVIFDVVGWFGS